MTPPWPIPATPSERSEGICAGFRVVLIGSRIGDRRLLVEAEGVRHRDEPLRTDLVGHRREHRVAAVGERLHERASAQLVVEVAQAPSVQDDELLVRVGVGERGRPGGQRRRRGDSLERRSRRLERHPSRGRHLPGQRPSADRGRRSRRSGTRAPSADASWRSGSIVVTTSFGFRPGFRARMRPGLPGADGAATSRTRGRPPRAASSDSSSPPWPYFLPAGQPALSPGGDRRPLRRAR